ncbi:hypothetical protein TPHA_0I01050 [Tetrapisispora phaffii CBS 4417]|uniref:Uncharacterized protein n=1 Tax=Tetrapisispora phaffii (strain ATCC 24235 / CBS 4417 / NBRC 1672 / NRRL Y-8282 / UCD 70-5) TaxID=1071381 RepID=G8BXI3_TETPH|nr:hypothetical protein TPHA_0I01050 [Tetrapisispora phaffii CBS 4417]CCE64611.1 hypothetical protein TPHA_0I01050 [Tetrapisispora phaffii CBS 4417]
MVDYSELRNSEDSQNTESGTNGIFSVDKNDLVLLVVSLLLPPFAVWIRKGFFTKDFFLNVIAYVCVFFPSTIHAAYIIYETSVIRTRTVTLESSGAGNAKKSTNSFDHDLEASNVPPSYEDGFDVRPLNTPSDNKIQI